MLSLSKHERVRAHPLWPRRPDSACRISRMPTDSRILSFCPHPLCDPHAPGALVGLDLGHTLTAVGESFAGQRRDGLDLLAEYPRLLAAAKRSSNDPFHTAQEFERVRLRTVLDCADAGDRVQRGHDPLRVHLAHKLVEERSEVMPEQVSDRIAKRIGLSSEEPGGLRGIGLKSARGPGGDNLALARPQQVQNGAVPPHFLT